MDNKSNDQLTHYNRGSHRNSPTNSYDSDSSMSSNTTARHRQFFRREFLNSYENQVNQLSQQFITSLGHVRGESVTHANILNSKIDVSVNEALWTVGNEIHAQRFDIDQCLLSVISDNQQLALTLKDQIEKNTQKVQTIDVNFAKQNATNQVTAKSL